MIKAAERMRKMHEELQPLRMTTRPQIQTESWGKKIRAVRNKLYLGPANETFHQFLINHLLTLLGKHWFENRDSERAN